MSPEPLLQAVLKALAQLETMDPAPSGFGFDGYTDEQISGALNELHRGGHIDDTG